MQTLIIAGALAAAVAGGAMTSGVMWAYDTYIDDPAVVADERARLTAEFTVQASSALAAEQLRQFQISERVYRDYYAAQQEDAAWQAAAIELDAKERADYEQRLSAAKREACSLDQLDLDYIDGRLVQPNPAGSGP